MRGTVCGCGSDATDAALSGHPPDRSEHRFLSAAGSGRLPSVRCGGRPFRNDCRSSSGEVYPAAPAACLFRAPGCSAFPAGRGSTLPVQPALFQQKDVVRRGVVHKPAFYQAYSATTRIKRPTAWSGRSATASAVASRCLPTTLPAAPVSGTLCHRGLTAGRSARAPAVWSAGTARLR